MLWIVFTWEKISVLLPEILTEQYLSIGGKALKKNINDKKTTESIFKACLIDKY